MTNDELLKIGDQIHTGLSLLLEQRMTSGELDSVPDREALQAAAQDLLEQQEEILTKAERTMVLRDVVDRMVGIGPLQPFLDDPCVTEIMVNNHLHVFIEKDGRIEKTKVVFRNETHLRHVINRIVAPLGRRIDEASPLVDARLPDGSRVNAIIPPLAIEGPALTIRKFARDPFTLERLVKLGTITQEMAQFLNTCVHDRVSIIVSGGTGSGKTSTLNALGRCIDPQERLITIEDSAELNLGHPNLVRLESRPPNIEGSGEIPIRTLARNALRMRPDRIIIGEVRGGEAFDMLQAMNTGHKGSMTTLHANSASDALIRLESMVLMAGFDLPVSAIRRMIWGAIEVILQQNRLPDGKRMITAIHRLHSSSDRKIQLKLLFEFDGQRGFTNTQVE
jgi:pilus assembly protein CpaF